MNEPVWPDSAGPGIAGAGNELSCKIIASIPEPSSRIPNLMVYVPGLRVQTAGTSPPPAPTLLAASVEGAPLPSQALVSKSVVVPTKRYQSGPGPAGVI